MKNLATLSTAVVLASSLAMASSAFARGSDHPEDNPHPENRSSSGGNSSHSSSGGMSSHSSSGDSKSRQKSLFPLMAQLSADTTPVKVGKAKLRVKSRRDRIDFRLDVKITKSLFDATDPADSTVTATFADSTGVLTNCDVEFDEISRKNAEFHLRLRQRGTGAVDDRMGICEQAASPDVVIIPSTLTGGSVSIDVSIPSSDINLPPTVYNLGTKNF